MADHLPVSAATSASGVFIDKIFYFGPFQFHSELDIPELRETHGSGKFRVKIGLGNVPVSLGSDKPGDRFCQATLTEFLLSIPRVARYYVAHGNEVCVEPVAGVPVSDVSAYLLGSVFGALCHQNGLLPLHASALEAGGRVTAFLGESGAGKSTLAACFRQRGFSIVADDICLLEPPRGRSGGMEVIPVAGWLKLWRESLDHLGEAAEEANRVFSSDEKYRVYLEPASQDRRTLGNLLFIVRDSSPGQTARLERLPAVETIALLIRFTYPNFWVDLTRNFAAIFRQCGLVVRNARGYRLTVPDGLDRLDEVLDLVEHEILAPPTPPR